MPNPKAARTTDGQLATAIASMVVQVLRQYTGRGPTKSRTYLHDELISVVLGGTLTQAERAFIAAGNSDLVLSNRTAFQGIMSADLIAGVEELTSRTVIALLSDDSLEPDVKLESFVLAPIATRPTTG